MKVGDVFKYFRSNYEVVAVFRDSGKEFYVAKRKNRRYHELFARFHLL